MCSRLESTSETGRIHVSKETAELIEKAGRPGWVHLRKDVVFVKGKGEIQTFWVHVTGDRAGSVTSKTSSAHHPTGASTDGGQQDTAAVPVLSTKTQRLVNWNVEMLLGLMQLIVANRNSRNPTNSKKLKKKKSHDSSSDHFKDVQKVGRTPLEEVMEIIHLPDFASCNGKTKQQDPDSVIIPDDVIEQLHMLVSEIAGMYHDNVSLILSVGLLSLFCKGITSKRILSLSF